MRDGRHDLWLRPILERIKFNGAARRTQRSTDLLPLCELRDGHLTEECQRDVIVARPYETSGTLEGQLTCDICELRRGITIRPERKK
jgi:hypothetical protein